MVGIALLLAFAVVPAVSSPVHAQGAPAENRGMKADALSALALGKQGLDDYAQRQFRMRQLTIEPGGATAFHSHKDRPALTLVLTGTLTEHRKDEPERTYRAGEVITEGTDVDHWLENKASDPPTAISVHLFK